MYTELIRQIYDNADFRKILQQSLHCNLNKIGIYTVSGKKCHFIFDNISHALIIFSKFCTVGNRNKYSTMKCNLLT